MKQATYTLMHNSLSVLFQVFSVIVVLRCIHVITKELVQESMNKAAISLL